MSRGAAVSLMLATLLLIPACNSDSRRLLEQAETRWREGHYDEALQLNTLLYKREREGRYGPQALLNIGNIYYLNLRQLREAIANYNKLVQEYPGRPEEYKARQQLAEIYANEVGDLNQAIAEYDRLLDWPGLENRREIEFLRANTFFRREDYAGALRELRRIEEQGVTGHLADQVYLKIGNIYQIQNRYEDALGMFQKVSESPCLECRRRAILHLMETYESVMDFDRAIEAIRKLDSSADNVRIAREVTRLSERRREVGSESVMDWTAARRAPARSSQRRAKPK